MKVYTKLTIDLETGQVLEDQSYNYEGPVSLCDGGGGGGGGGGLTAEESNALEIAGASPRDIEAMGGDREATGMRETTADRGENFLKAFFKGFGAGTTLTGNPAMGIMGGMIYGLSEAGLDFRGEPGAAPSVGNIEGAHPETTDESVEGTAFEGVAKGEGEGAGEEEQAPAMAPAEAESPEGVNIEERRRQEDRRRRARRRMGYWSTRRTDTDLGPLNVFTPELYG